MRYVRTSQNATTGRICSGLRGTALTAARDFMGSLGPRSATDLEGLYQGTHRSQQRTGTRRTWTTNLLRHRDYGIDRRHSGDSPPAHIGTAPPSKVIRHSTRTRRAPLPSGVRARAVARWAGGLRSGLLPADQAEQRIRDATFQGGVRMRPFVSVGP